MGMDFDQIIGAIISVEILTDLLRSIVGVGMCFGALKWRKGLMTTAAFYWGIFLGIFTGVMIFNINEELSVILVCAIIGALIFPILAYTVPAVNRFIVGYIVVTKIAYMFSTEIFRGGSRAWVALIIVPIIIGFIAGIIFAGMVKIPVAAFAVACSFLGASEIAPVISKYIGWAGFAISNNWDWIFDPLKIVFSFFSIELTDAVTLISLLLLMPWGIYVQCKYIKAQGHSYQTPLIVFETGSKEEHGKIVS